MKETGDEDTFAYRRLHEIVTSAFDDNSVDALLESMAAHIARLQAMPYSEYLETEEWKMTRHYAIERAGRRCQTCNRARRLQAHHRTYDRLGEEWLDDLTVMCDGCHETFHQHQELASTA